MINQNWVFGSKAIWDFNTTPFPTSVPLINTDEGCASISGSNGQLLFYTDGVTIWKNGGGIVYNTLKGDPSSTQSSIIVPDPAASDQYYVFTTDGYSGGTPYNHFDGVKLNVNSWAVAPVAGLPLTKGMSPVEKLTAVQHANCKDFWIITMVQLTSNAGAPSGDGVFRVFKVDSSGLSHIGDTSIGRQVHDLGYLKASPDGRTLALANGTIRNVLIYPFDNATGIISVSGLETATPPFSLPPGEDDGSWWVYGVEFSPKGQFLYVTLDGYKKPYGQVYQYNLATTPPTLTYQKSIATTLNNSWGLGALQLAVDQLIYLARWGEVKLGAILSPDTLGSGCNIVDAHKAVPAGSICRLGLPNLLPNPCVKDAGCDCNCSGCNGAAEAQNAELIERAKRKYRAQPSNNIGQACGAPFINETCSKNSAAIPNLDLTPCFYFHWGDGINDTIEEHDTEVFYLTVCNPFNDIRYNGLQIMSVTLSPSVHPIQKIQIVPDRLICLDCLDPCSCQTREFALITRADNTAGNYKLVVEYCYESITLLARGVIKKGNASFDLVITED